MKKSYRIMGPVLAVAVTAFAQTATATPIDYHLDFNNLPSAQGWSHTGSTIGQEVFTANGSTLAWNTMPYDVNVAYANYSYYTRGVGAAEFDATPWTLHWNVKVPESEPTTPIYYWAGAYTYVNLGGYNLGIGLGSSNMTIFKSQGNHPYWNQFFSFDIPDITDWTMITLATTADHRFSISLNGTLLNLTIADVLSSPPAYNGPAVNPNAWSNLLGYATHTTNVLYIGDGSIGSNANTETNCWYLTQTGASPDGVCGNNNNNNNGGGSSGINPVPEPGTILLLGGGLLGLLGYRAARRRTV